ncbi:MAG: hypothetical protein H6767_02415 [Candidatus Peribacteria bacterium]|nr:MAG: hypothetical protein H6767_02415 [Candidatus Peribacteria bacterium]
MQVKFKKTFEKQIQKLGPKVKDAFKERLQLFIQDKYNPTLRYHHLKGTLQDFSSINIS